MSALGGIYNFDEAPIDERALATLGAALAARGADDGLEYSRGSIGMAYRAFHTNGESRLEVQPLATSEGHILCWDGRLDNREELIPLFDLPDDQSDVALVMAAYARWGAGFLPRIIGDFALSLWDPKARTLLLARDAMGTRTLFYFTDANQIIWTSDINPLLSLAQIELEVDDEYVAGYLTTEPEPSRTPFKGIFSLTPGTFLTVRQGRVETRRFWRPDPGHRVRYKSDWQYEEHFLQLFTEAVRCRLRVDGPVWCELSGGFDSSSIVCVADRIIRNGKAQAPALKTVSYVFDESPTSDERSFIRSVEEGRGESGYHLREDGYYLSFPYEEQHSVTIPNPLHCFSERYKRLREEMQRSGARVLLSGNGGDHLLWSSVDASPELADLIVQRKLLRLHQRIRDWSQAQKRPYVDLLWKGAMRPNLPRSIQARCQTHIELYPWLDREFAARVNIRDRLLGPPDIFNFHLPSGRAQSTMLLLIISYVSAGYYRERGVGEISYPFLHRPLVEFCMAIPFDQMLRPGETRSLHRRALRDLLPEKVARRRSKRGIDEAIFRAVTREWPRLEALTRDARICARGYVNSHALRQALDRARHGQNVSTFALLRTLSLEFWLRSFEQRDEWSDLSRSLAGRRPCGELGYSNERHTAGR